EPCNQCRSCIEISKSASIDVQEIDGASNTGVDSVREIRENIMYQPVSEKYRIYIIDEVHMLSTSAFNALLKTLEEPPAHGVFIFATTEPAKIPQTIISRCQSFDFKKLTVEAIKDTIKDITTKEGITATDDALYTIAREARGSLRDSLSALDQVISYSGNNFTKDDVKAVLGFVDKTVIFEIAKSIITNDPRTALSLNKKLFDEGYDVKKVVDGLVEVFKNLVFMKNGLEDLLGDALPDHEVNELKQMSQNASPADVEQWFYMAHNAAEETVRSSYSWTMLDVCLLSMCAKPNNDSISDLISKLNSCEKEPSKEQTAEKKSPHPQYPNNQSGMKY
ncbi:MAG TPA: DNA polymerase III subunit gamma/tau, partial [bacterium]|nr:DNA polymerase III subunit gamma/tau [bacterium]